MCGRPESSATASAGRPVAHHRPRRDIWAAGWYSPTSPCLILHWDGTTWTPARPAKPRGGCALRTVAAVKGDGAWAIGAWSLPPRYIQHGLILHWNGGTWT